MSYPWCAVMVTHNRPRESPFAREETDAHFVRDGVGEKLTVSSGGNILLEAEDGKYAQGSLRRSLP